MAKTIGSKALPGRPPSLEFAEPYSPASLLAGQTVQIKSGQLSGLAGVVVKVNDDGYCLIELAELGPGVLVTIHSRQVSRT